jgi:hypothetical protein
LRHAVDSIDSQTESISLVANGKLERRVDVALLLVTANVEVAATRTLVCQAVHHPGVTVEVEDDRSVISEEAGPLRVGKTVGVVAGVDQLKEIDNVDASNLELREVLKQEINGSQGLVGANITARGHDQVGILSSIGGELRPDTNTLGAVLDGSVHGEVLKMLLLIRNDNVNVVD